jgi:hypothetical protein
MSLTAFLETNLLSDNQKRHFAEMMLRTLQAGQCQHDFAVSRQILSDMSFGADETDTILRFFIEHGGMCDCEIIYNLLTPD